MMMDNTPRPVPIGPSRTDKRKHRRRKSKYARPLFSLAHGAVLLQLILLAGFAAAVAHELTIGDPPAPEQDPSLSGLNLPGDEAPSRPRGGPPGFAQLLLWAYLFGAPALFSLQRSAFWHRTITSLKLVSYTAVALWFAIILIFLVLANQA